MCSAQTEVSKERDTWQDTGKERREEWNGDASDDVYIADGDVCNGYPLRAV
jgi:hypothetical protein